MAARDEVGVLALPAEAGALGERLFHHRRGVDEDLDAGGEAGGDEAGEVFELALEHVVIVAAAGIDGDAAAIGPGEDGERVVGGRVGEAERR